MVGSVHWSIVLIGGLFLVSVQGAKETRKRITYFSTEHPRIVYYDTKYADYSNVTARRHSRKDPFYYVDFHINLLVPYGNNVTVSFYFYELLTNVYKRGFIEMHMGVCDLVLNDKFFGGAMRRNFNNAQIHCPFPKGEYHYYNMTIPIEQVPRGFPFTRGRIYCNVSITNTDKVIGSGYIDLELKTAWVSY
ncbi:uncharacterized protein LOC131851337 [Achroia grisella]|uniref:uncharacterized protein LOC131851337 n=1 Tax=Achroia grisella TaxID=688607 RepID=UPI0027D2D907|nr:uncharacterized protein LOC131851337 [Achroia grisella]